MSNIDRLTAKNVMFQARMRAKEYIPALSDRTSAAELLSMNPKRLYLIEKGSVQPRPDEIHMFIRIYKDSSIGRMYCLHGCPNSVYSGCTKKTYVRPKLTQAVGTNYYGIIA